MAEDMKYGHVILQHGNVGDLEPVVVFRARDKLLREVLNFYWTICRDAGSPEHHLNLISQRTSEIEDWQERNKDQVRVPRSDGYHAAHEFDGHPELG